MRDRIDAVKIIIKSSKNLIDFCSNVLYNKLNWCRFLVFVALLKYEGTAYDELSCIPFFPNHPDHSDTATGGAHGQGAFDPGNSSFPNNFRRVKSPRHI